MLNLILSLAISNNFRIFDRTFNDERIWTRTQLKTSFALRHASAPLRLISENTIKRVVGS